MEKIKFEFISYLKGYGSWHIEIYDGTFSVESGYYLIRVLRGKKAGQSGTEVLNKSYRVPIDSTIIEENI